MTSKQILEITQKHLGFQINFKTRYRPHVYARALVSVLSRNHTTEPLESIGETVRRDHSNVIHLIKSFKNTYIYQTTPFDVKKEYVFLDNFLSSLNVESKQEKEEDNSIEAYIEALQNKIYKKDEAIINLKNQIKQLKEKKKGNKHPLYKYIEQIPHDQYWSVEPKLNAIVKCLPKKNLHLQD